eukprot:gene45852-61285_t
MDALGGLYGATGEEGGRKGNLFWFEFPYIVDATAAAKQALLKPV